MNFKLRPIHAVVAVPLLVGVLWPWTEQVVPPWTVRVVTRSGRPAPGVPVQRTSMQQTMERKPSTELRRTDAAGEVHFPQTRIRVNAAGLILGTASSILRYWHHASFGPFGQIAVGIEDVAENCDVLVYSRNQDRATTIQSECVVPDGFKPSTFDTVPALPEAGVR